MIKIGNRSIDIPKCDYLPVNGKTVGKAETGSVDLIQFHFIHPLSPPKFYHRAKREGKTKLEKGGLGNARDERNRVQTDHGVLADEKLDRVAG
jgi:hypothetical protein